MKATRIIAQPAILITLSAILIAFQNSNAQKSKNAQTGKHVCNILIQKTKNNVILLTPASEKIVFSKIIKDGEATFTMQLQALGSDLYPGKGLHIVLTNGREIELPDLSITIGIPDNDKVAFKYTGTIKLTYVQTEYLRNDPVKEYSLGNFKCLLSKTEQNRFLNYFNCLLKDTDPASLTTNQPASSW